MVEVGMTRNEAYKSICISSYSFFLSPGSDGGCPSSLRTDSLYRHLLSKGIQVYNTYPFISLKSLINLTDK